MTRLAEKRAIVTGGTGGIGLATSTLFVQEGAKVLLVDLNENALQEAVATIGSDAASYVVADVTQPEQVQHYTRTAVERWGGHRCLHQQCRHRRRDQTDTGLLH